MFDILMTEVELKRKEESFYIVIICNEEEWSMNFHKSEIYLGTIWTIFSYNRNKSKKFYFYWNLVMYYMNFLDHWRRMTDHDFKVVTKDKWRLFRFLLCPSTAMCKWQILTLNWIFYATSIKLITLLV